MLSRTARAITSSATSRLGQLTQHLSPHSSLYNQQIRMASQTTTFKLNNGATIPAIGFGTWQDADAQENAVLTALKAGYRHIDGARVYGTEPQVGKAIKQSNVSRKDIFLTTKLWNNKHHPNDVEQAIDASLKDLQTDYLDLYLMHWPSCFAPSDEMFPKDSNDKLKVGDIDYLDTWKAMEALVKKGKTKAIGISNFSKAEVERLLSNCSIPPAVHQLECHPYLQQSSFIDFHKQNNIHVTEYSPFGNQNPIYTKGENLGKLIDDPVLNEIGKKYGKNGAQVALAWGIATGKSVIPKSKTPERIQANFQLDFKLTDDEVKKINSIDKKFRFNDPSATFGYEFYSDLEGKGSS